jgi:integrase
MPRRSKGPRLWLQPARRDEDGQVIEQAVWVLRDCNVKRSTGAGEGEIEKAESALRDYLNEKAAPRIRDRDPAAVPIANVVAIYAEGVAAKHARPKETAARLGCILDYFGDKPLGYLTRQTCDEYVKERGHVAAARRELEDLRAAIRHHWEEGLCSAVTPVVLPAKSTPRERWLSRSEAARLLWAAWRLRQRWKGHRSSRPTAKHVARFIIAGLYTGTRAGAICGAALRPSIGRGWIDAEHGVFYRQPAGKKRTKKRQPSIRMPPRFLAHVRRWIKLRVAMNFLIEWESQPVKRINKAFRTAVRAAGLGKDVTPHTLRHTAITWQAQLGVPVHEICGFFGVTREVFEEVYAHHHPDYQANAVNALSRPRQKPDRYAATKREQTASRVVNLHRNR